MAAATVAFIIFRLADATTPVLTTVVLEAQVPLSLESLHVEGQELLPRGWAPAGSQSAQAADPGAGALPAKLALQVGRPASLTARLSLPGTPSLSCTLEPRPFGECVLRVNIRSATNLSCEYECKSPSPRP